jgi:hypothetical protein
MEDYENERDERLEQRLRKQARERVEFKRHLLTFIIVIGALWAINYLTQMNDRAIYWWAIWPTLGWGIGLVFHLFSAFTGLNEDSLAEREYYRLRRRRGLTEGGAVEPLEDKRLEQRLRKQAKARAEFKMHLLVYLVINAGLWALNYLTQMGDARINWWAIWPTAGWAVAVLIHAVVALTGFESGEAVEREYERLRRKHNLD